MVTFDPRNLAYGSPDDLATGYEAEWGLFWGAYTAWPADVPCIVGQGCSEHWALVDLARELRGHHWGVDDSLTAVNQLACAARSLGERDLVAYLEQLAEPAELSGEYGLVLR